MLYEALSSLQYSLRQGLSIRGHCKENGNLMQLLHCHLEDSDDLKLWITRKNIFHEIINEEK